MEIYDTEEEQVAALKRWWKENGASTITGVVVGLVMIIGWNFWQSYNKDKAYQASALYQQLLTDVSADKNESAGKIAERITDLYSSTTYATYAALLAAKTKVQQGDLQTAKTIFEKLMHEAGSEELKHLARIRLIKLLQETDDNEKGLQLIAEVDQTSIKGFAASYDELKGDLYVALDRIGEARTAYQSALRAGAQSPLLQLKLDDVSAVEIIESSAVTTTKSFEVVE